MVQLRLHQRSRTTINGTRNAVIRDAHEPFLSNRSLSALEKRTYVSLKNEVKRVECLFFFASIYKLSIHFVSPILSLIGFRNILVKNVQHHYQLSEILPSGEVICKRLLHFLVRAVIVRRIFEFGCFEMVIQVYLPIVHHVLWIL